METIGYWILTAFLIWLAVHYWILPGKITDTVGKLIIAAFVIWLLGNIAYSWAADGWTRAFSIWQLVLLAAAGVAFWLLRTKRNSHS